MRWLPIDFSRELCRGSQRESNANESRKAGVRKLPAPQADPSRRDCRGSAREFAVMRRGEEAKLVDRWGVARDLQPHATGRLRGQGRCKRGNQDLGSSIFI